MPTFPNSGIPIAYEVHGEGLPILCIHGFGSSGKVNWIDTGWVETLTQAGYQPITYDNRGHGNSRKAYDSQLYYAHEMAEDARGLLDHLGIGRCPVLGYSMGARFAAFLALRRSRTGCRVRTGAVFGVQGSPVLGAAVMAGYARAGVFGVEDGVGHQLSDVVVVEAVEDRGSLAAGADQSRHPQFGQMLRHRGRRLADVGGEVVDRHFPIYQGPQHLNAGGVGQHPEHLDHEIDLILREGSTACTVICIHTQVIGGRSGWSNADGQ